MSQSAIDLSCNSERCQLKIVWNKYTFFELNFVCVVEKKCRVFQDERILHFLSSYKTTNGLDEYVGADFKLCLPPKSEVVGHLMVGFESSDPLRLNIDEYGICAEKYVFELLLVDARMNRYTATMREAGVFAKGDFLWKVKQQKGIPHKFRAKSL
ncbi:hypothetical protein [Paenibacillus polymyxa]|uniref:hypothetical protein n=1 Tax=Paenibacillus polymyxa TaxID=1406 RepID=UPI000DD5CFE3|nr:hypothetical protein [Paenibacillus polymyxa]